MTTEAPAMLGRAYHWPLYRGTKTLKAEPATKGEYCRLRGWTGPVDEDPNEAGYVVEYQDGGAPNVEGFAGYVSWSPAGVFEKAYHLCGSHVERMQVEHDELAERLAALTLFINDANTAFRELTYVDRDLLRAQQQAMFAYLGVLTMRLNRVTHG